MAETMAGKEPLFSAMLRAPLIAVDPDAAAVLHAVSMDEVCRTWPGSKAPNEPMVAACGTAGMVAVGTPDGFAVEWPPRVRTLPEGVTRCRACQAATGYRPPRSEFVQKGGPDGLG